MTVKEGILSIFKDNQLWTSDQNELVCGHLKKRWSVVSASDEQKKAERIYFKFKLFV